MSADHLKYYFDEDTLDNAVNCLMFETELGNRVLTFNDENESDFAITYSTDNKITVYKYPEYCVLLEIHYSTVISLVTAVRRALRFAKNVKVMYAEEKLKEV